MLKLKRNDLLLIVDCLVTKRNEIDKLVDSSHYSDFKPLYVDWLNDIENLLNKFRKELSYEKKDN